LDNYDYKHPDRLQWRGADPGLWRLPAYEGYL